MLRLNLGSHRYHPLFGGLSSGISDVILGTESANLIAYFPLNETPASQDYLTFNGTNTIVTVTDAASIQNLHDAELTVDTWVYINTANQAKSIISKHDDTDDTGWELFTSGGDIYFRVKDNTGTISQSATAEVVGSWIHIAGYFNDATDRKAYVAVSGTWAEPGSALTNPIGSDIGDDLIFGRKSRPAVNFFDGRIGWIRISNNNRLGVGVGFTPPTRTTIPTVDANTVGLWAMNEGYGSIVGDLSVNSNNGTVSNGDWGAYPAADNAEGTAARDGAYTGVTLGQSATPFTCPLFDGVNDFTNIYSASLAGAFNGAAGSLTAFARVSGSGVWADTTQRMVIKLRADANNRIEIYKSATDNRFDFLYRAGSISQQIAKTSLTETGWIHATLTWDAVADEVKAYYNGIQEGLTQTGLGTWAGAIIDTVTMIGASNNTPDQVWDGYLAHAAIWTKALTGSQILSIAQAGGVA